MYYPVYLCNSCKCTIQYVCVTIVSVLSGMLCVTIVSVLSGMLVLLSFALYLLTSTLFVFYTDRVSVFDWSISFPES